MLCALKAYCVIITAVIQLVEISDPLLWIAQKSIKEFKVVGRIK